MKNKLKIAILGIVSSILLSACFESSPESVVEDYLESLYSKSFDEVSNFLSFKERDSFAYSVTRNCRRTKDVKSEVISLLKESKIDSNALTEYDQFSSEIQNKVASICFEKMMVKSLKERGEIKTKIINSEIYKEGKKAKVKIEGLSKDGRAHREQIRLEKIDGEWKITRGLI